MEYGEVGRLKKVMERLGFRVREWMMEEKEEF